MSESTAHNPKETTAAPLEAAARTLAAEHPAAFPATADEIEMNPVVIKVAASPVLFTPAYELHWNWDDRGWTRVAT